MLPHQLVRSESVNIQPKVSVALPVYNGERFLRQAIESILGQSCADFELLICDNASTDCTADISMEYTRRDARVRYYRNARNLGAAKNFNRGFELAEGEYFKWIAADDVCEPEFLEQCLLALEQAPTAALAYPRTKWIDETGAVVDVDEGAVRSSWPDDPVRRFSTVVHDMLEGKANGQLIGAGVAPVYIFGLMRTSALRQTRLLGSYLAADLNLLAELSLTGTFVQVPVYLNLLRRHPGSLSHNVKHGMSQPIFSFWNPGVAGALPKIMARGQSRCEYFVSVWHSDLHAVAKVESAAQIVSPVLRSCCRWAKSTLCMTTAQKRGRPTTESR